MNEFREKMLEEIKALFEKNIYRVDENIFSDESIEFFTKETEKLLEEIIEKQKFDLEEVTNIFLMLSRINIKDENLQYKVYCYGENMYIDKLKFESKFDISYVFNEFLETKNKIHRLVRKYVKFDIEEGLKESSKYILLYNFIVVKVLRVVFKKEEIVELLEKIAKNKKFHIVVGEIYEKPYLIYNNDENN